MYRLEITARAKRDLKKIREFYQLEVKQALDDLREDPRIGKSLGEDLINRFSYKIGVYRIIYKINEKDKVVEIITAGHRSTVYH